MLHFKNKRLARLWRGKILTGRPEIQTGQVKF